MMRFTRFSDRSSGLVWQRSVLRVLVAGMTLAVVACADVKVVPPVTDRVVLLPQADGKPSAVELSTTAGQRLRLDQPYAAAQLQGGAWLPATTDAAAVQARYGSLLSLQPARPRSFVLPFEANTTRLGPAAEAVRELLIKAGVDGAMITVAGRGKRELLVPTADGVAEARNRRVEIKIR